MSIGVSRMRRGCVAILVGSLSAGCSSSDTDDGPSDKPEQRLAVACTDATDVFYERPTDLPAFDASHRGDVVRCGPYGKFSLGELQATMTTLGYSGSIMTTGASAYRVAYRTERSQRVDGTRPEGIAGATVFLPNKPRVDGPLPLLVVAHGTIGVGERCAPSKGELTTVADHLDEYRALIIPLIAAGWVVISPDYPGYGYGETTGYMDAEDAAHGVLDATRAASKLLAPGVLSGKVAFVGQSQGGHAVLSAHAYEPTYGMEGTLEGVAAMAPLWFSPLAFAAMLSPLAGYSTAKSPYPLSYSMAYFYTHGENIDGPGHGTDMFQADKRDRVRSLLTDGCLFEVGEAMPSLGETPSDYFDPDFANSVGVCGISGVCDEGDALLWGARCRADRPEMNPNGAPILLWFGGLDPTVTPGLAVCGLDNLRAGIAAASDATTTLKVCVDPTAYHSGYFVDKDTVDLTAAISRRSMDWVDQWIAARTIGGEEPGACEGEEAFATESGPLKCSTPPPND